MHVSHVVETARDVHRTVYGEIAYTGTEVRRSIRMGSQRWAGHVAPTAETCGQFLYEILKGLGVSGDLEIKDRMLLLLLLLLLCEFVSGSAG